MNITNSNKSYQYSNHSVFSCQYHVVFCPKYRRPVLDERIAKRLKEIFKKESDSLRAKILEMEVLTDHVHLLLDVNPKIGVYSTVTQLKGRSSSILRKEFPDLKKRLPCLWSRNKFISTVGDVSLETVKKYIENQKNV